MGLRLSDVTCLLNDALRQTRRDGQAQERELAALSSLAQPSRIIELLRSLHSNRDAAAACAEQSYLHPLGFYKLMLIDAAPLFELRVHVWWPSSRPGVDHVHNHRFSFVSTVVCGGYDMQVFQVDPAGEEMAEYREVASPDTGWRLESVGRARLASPDTGWRLEPVGRARLGLLTSAKLRQGSSYALSAEALHRVSVPPGTLCVTLLLRTAIADSTTQVFAEPGHVVSTAIPKMSLSSDDYRAHLEALLDELAG